MCLNVNAGRDESEHYEVVLGARQDAGPNLVALSLTDVPASLLQTYHTAGQYLIVDFPDVPLYLALASEPGASTFELLVRTGGGKAADRLAEMPVGARLRVKPVSGRGFPSVQDRPFVWLLAAGSGIAPLRAVMRQRLAEGKDLKNWTLVWGARNQAYRPYLDEISTWEARGLRLVYADSEPQGASSPRYVQDALGDLPLDVSATVVLVCGMKPMIEAVKEQLAARGLPDEAIHMNY